MEERRRWRFEGSSSTRRERSLGLYCGALRESGILILVFAALDATFNLGKPVSHGVVATWLVIGLAVLVIGVHLDPKGE